MYLVAALYLYSNILTSRTNEDFSQEFISSPGGPTLEIVEPPKQPQRPMCVSGYATKHERLVLQGVADVQGVTDPRVWDAVLYIYFLQIRPHLRQNIIICSISKLNHNCQGFKRGDDCYCSQVTPTRYQIVMNVTARRELDQRRVIAQWVSTTNDYVWSNEVDFPKIWVVEERAADMIINGVTLQTTHHPNCTIDLSVLTQRVVATFCVKGNATFNHTIRVTYNKSKVDVYKLQCVELRDLERYTSDGHLVLEYWRSWGCKTHFRHECHVRVTKRKTFEAKGSGAGRYALDAALWILAPSFFETIL